MFIRKKKNRSGSTSVVVVDKHGGKFKELHTVGISCDEQEIAELCKQGKSWIENHLGILELDFDSPDRKAQEIVTAEITLNNIDSILLYGTKLILDKVYDSVGFNCINDDVLRHLMVARLCQPMSKMVTVDYLRSHFNEDLNLSKIYRYLDKLYNSQQEMVQRISVEHTFSVLGGRVEMLFYDVTSLYFESFHEDDLRSPGFSKDGKTAETQIILGLLVCEKGYPFSYSIFKGAQYESNTTIETRPIFHFTERRIEAHVCLCFVAYKVYKELERIICTLGLDMSVDSVLKIAKTITTIRLRLPLNEKIITRTMMLTPEHQSILPLFGYLGI